MQPSLPPILHPDLEADVVDREDGKHDDECDEKSKPAVPCTTIYVRKPCMPAHSPSSLEKDKLVVSSAVGSYLLPGVGNQVL